MTLGLEPLAYVALGAGAVLAFRRVVDALMRWRWLVGDDPHPAVGQTRSHVRLVRDDGFTAVQPGPNASADDEAWPPADLADIKSIGAVLPVTAQVRDELNWFQSPFDAS